MNWGNLSNIPFITFSSGTSVIQDKDAPLSNHREGRGLTMPSSGAGPGGECPAILLLLFSQALHCGILRV